MATSLTSSSNVTAPTQFVHAASETYAYRRFGGGAAPPLLCQQHFTGTLDNWDPAVTDVLASGREILLFDNAGIGRSTGKVPETIQGMQGLHFHGLSEEVNDAAVAPKSEHSLWLAERNAR
jgi:pimeloyl-ACP methyl ester carboxylesterase